MLSYLFFALGFALLLVHEMDAIRLAEWKIFPWLSGLGEETGYRVFAALHVPLYALVSLGLVRGGGESGALIRGLDAFFVVHVGLHWVFRNHPENRFRSVFSWALILEAGACGAAGIASLL